MSLILFGVMGSIGWSPDRLVSGFRTNYKSVLGSKVLGSKVLGSRVLAAAGLSGVAMASLGRALAGLMTVVWAKD